MKPYYEREGIQLFHADCRDVLPTLDPLKLDAGKSGTPVKEMAR